MASESQCVSTVPGRAAYVGGRDRRKEGRHPLTARSQLALLPILVPRTFVSPLQASLVVSGGARVSRRRLDRQKSMHVSMCPAQFQTSRESDQLFPVQNAQAPCYQKSLGSRASGLPCLVSSVCAPSAATSKTLQLMNLNFLPNNSSSACVAEAQLDGGARNFSCTDLPNSATQHSGTEYHCHLQLGKEVEGEEAHSRIYAQDGSRNTAPLRPAGNSAVCNPLLCLTSAH